jgi:putative ABC transport system permease protein
VGVRPLFGRTFTEEEDTPGGDTRVVVLAYDFWQRHYGGDPGVLERSLELDDLTHRVVGVMPRGFAFPERVDVWKPLAPSLSYHRGDRRLNVVARLAPGVAREQAADELAAVARQIAFEHPASNAGWSAQLMPFSDWFVTPQLERRVIALLVAVGLLLVMACVNVASLLLARAGTRQREIAVRTALGAGRRRLVRQLLTESVVLSHLGAVVGVAAAAVAIPIVRRIGSTAIARLDGLALDWRVLVFAYGACLTTGILFGLVPALQVSGSGWWRRGGGLEVLRSGARTIVGGRVRHAMIVTSVALAMLLLVCAGLVGGSFVKLMRVPLGFSPEQVLTASIRLPPLGEGDEGERIARLFDGLTRRLGDLPGVRAAGATSIAPFSGGNTAMEFQPAGLAIADEREYRLAGWRVVTPDYFAALEIPLIHGRLLESGDRAAAPPVAVINQTMARIGWPDTDPIGKVVDLESGRSMTIVGVVGDTRDLFADSLPPPTMYFPHGQFAWRSMWLTVRTTGDPMSTVGAVRREVAAMNPGIVLTRVQPLTRLVRDTTAGPRLTVLVFAIFATAALVLAAIGLYGIVSYSVTQRTREIGVRMALGARPGGIVGSVLGQGVRLALIGVALGGLLAYWAVRALRSILYETEPTDPATFIGIAVMLVLVAGLASVVPAIRAARVDPLGALRSE